MCLARWLNNQSYFLGLLIQVYNRKLNLTYSYLSSDHVVDPHLVEVKLEKLVNLLYGGEKSQPIEKLQLMYSIENR